MERLGHTPAAHPVPRYEGLTPASKQASRIAQTSSKKSGTRCELALRRALWRLGCRYRLGGQSLPGAPDLVFPGARVVVFCDGDFWHGRNWEQRRARLAAGTNAHYWVAKIERNIRRDQEVTERLEGAGWSVLRFWESEILRSPHEVARVVEARARGARLGGQALTLDGGEQKA